MYALRCLTCEAQQLLLLESVLKQVASWADLNISLRIRQQQGAGLMVSEILHMP